MRNVAKLLTLTDYHTGPVRREVMHTCGHACMNEFHLPIQDREWQIAFMNTIQEQPCSWCADGLEQSSTVIEIDVIGFRQTRLEHASDA